MMVVVFVECLCMVLGVVFFDVVVLGLCIIFFVGVVECVFGEDLYLVIDCVDCVFY